jgi:hypothetical protein
MTATPSASIVATPGSTAEQALLLRLLPPTKTAPSPRVVMTACNKLFRQPLSSEQWTAATNELRSGGFLENKGLKLTPAGRQRALDLLGLIELPPRTTWGSIQAKFLLPRALGHANASEQERKRLNTQDKLAALLLTRSLQLPQGSEASLKNALEALVCQKLGFPKLCSLEELKEVVLSDRLKSPEKLTGKQLLKQVPQILLGTKKAGLPPLRDIALLGWADAVSPDRNLAPIPVAELDLPAFAAAVQTAARTSSTGWFGDNKVFISHVWRRLKEATQIGSLDCSAFKRKLVEASAQGLLVLSRADLVQVMDPVDVDESATSVQNATFHFILVDGKQS